MPYRVDLPGSSNDAFDRLVELGALDVERVKDGIAALMPDSVPPEHVARALGFDAISVSPAAGRDADSVWVLGQRPIRYGRIRLLPANCDAEPDAVKLIDRPAFGTGLHPTTALCLQALDEALQGDVLDAVLDVGTGSGVLALAALSLGVPLACGVDIDEDSLRVAEENARINGMGERLRLTRGGPEAVTEAFPLVLANILAASLIEMAPILVRRVGHHGRLVLSGIPLGVEQEVEQTYRRMGMRALDVKSSGGWIALVLQATW